MENIKQKQEEVKKEFEATENKIKELFEKKNEVQQELNNALEQEKKIYEQNPPVGPTDLMRNTVQAMLLKPDVASVCKKIENNPEEGSSYIKEVRIPDNSDPNYEEGILSVFAHFDQPYRGFPFFEIVDKLNENKKNNKFYLKAISTALSSTSKWKLAILYLLFKKQAVQIIKEVFEGTYKRLVELQCNPKMYCRMVQEFNRVFDIYMEKEEYQDIKDIIYKVKVCFDVFMEFDNAYRFRVQDLIDEIEIVNLEDNPLKEIDRIIGIAISREIGPVKKREYAMIRRVLIMYLKRDKRILELIKRFLLDLKYNKIRFDKYDLCYIYDRKDYKFGILDDQYKLTNELRKAIKRIEEKEETGEKMTREILANVRNINSKEIGRETAQPQVANPNQL